MASLASMAARRRSRDVPPADLAEIRPSSRDFAAWLSPGRAALSVVAELRRRDRRGRHPPRPDLDLVALARRLDDAEVAGASVGTDPDSWGADLDDLRAVSEACESLPLLRRDVLLSAADLHLSRLAGADAVWLLPALLDEASLRRLGGQAASMHMTAVAACWETTHVESALRAGARVLELFTSEPEDARPDLGRVERLAEASVGAAVLLASGGIGVADADRLRGLVDGVVLGEALLGSPDPASVVRVFGEAQ